MMRRIAAVAASAFLSLASVTTAHAADPATLVTVSGDLVVTDESDDEIELWEASAELTCPEGTVAVAGGADELPDPWGTPSGWAHGRTWTAYSAPVEKSEVPDVKEGDSVGTAYAVCLETTDSASRPKR
ncbi:hypothetical protein ACW14Y_04910 [Kitasatospora sp. cg17-2]